MSLRLVPKMEVALLENSFLCIAFENYVLALALVHDLYTLQAPQGFEPMTFRLAVKTTKSSLNLSYQLLILGV